jgi:ATP-dependent DNA helicase RecQ
VVFHDKTLVEIAAREPRSLAELAEISGIGPAKLDRYGADVLEVLRKDA